MKNDFSFTDIPFNLSTRKMKRKLRRRFKKNRYIVQQNKNNLIQYDGIFTGCSSNIRFIYNKKKVVSVEIIIHRTEATIDKYKYLLSQLIKKYGGCFTDKNYLIIKPSHNMFPDIYRKTINKDDDIKLSIWTQNSNILLLKLNNKSLGHLSLLFYNQINLNEFKKEIENNNNKDI